MTTTNPKDALGRGDALLIVDVQNDFCPGGALPIEQGDQVIPVLNEWIAAAVSVRIPVYASRDWHPRGHVSFRESGGPWPAHCLQDTDGARFGSDLRLPEDTVKVTKGVRFDHDQNSAFDETGLAAHLRSRGIRRLWIGGLAQDVCVLATVLDARAAGFEVTLIRDATRGVTPAGCAAADERMREAGARFTATHSTTPA
ncbi:MAG TPA: isochorismatase family protein [Steroidobacteraceae bacterium]|nr:isochorismatase family protein [Steroidobacteraceae bacterium]